MTQAENHSENFSSHKNNNFSVGKSLRIEKSAPFASQLMAVLQVHFLMALFYLMAYLDGTGAVTVFVGFGGYLLVLMGMLMAFCMASASNLPAFLYGSSEAMTKAYGSGGEFLIGSALAVQDFNWGCAAGAIDI